MTPASRVAARFLAAAYSGNPGGAPIYPVEVDHGYTEALGGGTDVMRRLQNRLRVEQGREPRRESPRLARNLSEILAAMAEGEG